MVEVPRPVFYAGVFALLFALLFAIGVLSAVARRVGYALLGALVRTARRVGVYDPGRRTPGTTRRHVGRSPDRPFVLLSRVLRALSRLLPGDPPEDTRPIIVPVLVVGVPIVIGALLALWAVPLVLLGQVLGETGDRWSTLAGYLGLFVYFGAVPAVLRLRRRNWSVFGRLRRRS